jgi:NAD(P)-dependent dehydrogenase (short-subunit alcohol dehydrogenase family)
LVRRPHFGISYPLNCITIYCTGLAIVDSIASKDPSAIIYAGVRDPSDGASQLEELVTKYPGRVEIVKYVAGDKEGNDAIAMEIKAMHSRVDTVIANAGEEVPILCALRWSLLTFPLYLPLGIANYTGKLHETPVDVFQEHFSVRALNLYEITFHEKLTQC